MWRVTGVCLSLLCLVTSSLGDGAGYGAPEPAGYQPSYDGYSAVGSAEPDLTPILIGILVLTGLALLFPSYVTLSSVRRKRSVGAGQDDSAASIVNRIQDMSLALMESEECMERVACEMGGLVEDAGISKSMTKMVEKFAPKKYAKMMKNFNHGKDCKKNNKCGLF